MAYKHQVSISESGTSVLSPVEAAAGLPVYFGTAPIHLTDNPSAYVNKPVLAYSYEEAVKALGYHSTGTTIHYARLSKLNFSFLTLRLLYLSTCLILPSTRRTWRTAQLLSHQVNTQLLLTACCFRPWS
ncbi:hypothetical protein ACFSND_31095 [Brevibacillus brevis]|uniref:hypothetical protein n=1 Tax=Brevibacillus brevis TaxID=1393 RepID=UPI003629AA12